MNSTRLPFEPSLPPLHAWPGGHDDANGGGLGGGSEPQPRPLHGKRILLVEDEAMLAFELQFALEESGAEVLGPALTFAEATEMFETHDAIDGAVLDVNLAGMSVIPLAVDLARMGVPLLFNTGHASKSELRAVFPGAEVLSKPTDPEVLASRLAELIGRPKPN